MDALGRLFLQHYNYQKLVSYEFYSLSITNKESNNMKSYRYQINSICITCLKHIPHV